MIDLIQLGEEIGKARRALGWSQADLVMHSGVSRARIDALENGRAPDFGVKRLGKVLQAVGLDLRLTTANNNRPTLDDLTEETENAPRLGR